MHSAQARAQAIAAYYEPPATGRPSEIGDAALLQQLFIAIEEGNYLETACHLAGLSPVTVHNWKKRGETGERPFADFVRSVKEAEARAEAKMLANVRRASELPQFWAAGMTVLERRHPDRWGKRQDDTQAPRVVVQIGVGQGEVKVGVALSPPSFAPDSSLAECNNANDFSGFAVSTSPIIKNSDNQTNSEGAGVPMLVGETERQIPAGSSGGGSIPHAPSATSRGRLARGKGRSPRNKKKA